MRNIPKTIYLQIGDRPDADYDFDNLQEITWSQDKINDTDLEYELVTDGPRKLTDRELYEDLFKSYRKQSVLIGQLKAEIEELIYENKAHEERYRQFKQLDIISSRQAKMEMKRQDYVQKINEQNKNLRAKVKRYQKDNSDLIYELIKYRNAKEKELVKQADPQSAQ